MGHQFARQINDTQWIIGNDRFELAVSLDQQGTPTLTGLRTPEGADWAAQGRAFGPTIGVSDVTYRPGASNMRLAGAQVDAAQAELRLNYTCDNGLQVCHHLSPSPDKAVWRSWTTLVNPTDKPIKGINRFDVLNLLIGVSAAEPQASYVLGWLDGPRADAPGHHAIPYPYPSWIPRLLYGDGAPKPPAPPPGGWSSPVLRLVQERLTKLPLRSGKRSTYDNYPWVAVMDPGRQAGWFIGFEWSGSWKMDVEHFPADQTVSVFTCTDACIHTLKPGDTLESPPAFTGLFTGAWDDAFNASGQYISDEVLPPKPVNFPLLSANIGCPLLPTYAYGDFSRADEYSRACIDAAADAGMEDYMVDASWWSASPLKGDFSLGLGDFADHRVKFPHGLRAVSDYVHSKGMKFGLWFEFERVDIRTANTGRNPWKPEWILHQKGYPYRSWCQHVFLLCLGVKAAAEWARENIAWAIREYDVDWMKIDSNEWAACDDSTHDHMETDGEWAQVQGLYYVLKGLRSEFPNLILENCAGGSQRGDLGMARYCDFLASHDTNWPSAIARKYSHGASSMFPPYYAKSSLPVYPPGFIITEGGWDPDPGPLDWRILSRMMGMFENAADLPEYAWAALKKTIPLYKEIRPALHGCRYVLNGPPVIIERENRETGQWEAYQFVAPDGKLASVFFYRCLSHLPELHVALKGLAPQAHYSASTYSGQSLCNGKTIFTGAELMNAGVTCRLEKTLMADVLVLRKLS